MARNIGTSRTLTVQDRRETFRLGVEVSGTDAVPVYTLRGDARITTRDADGAAITDRPGQTTIIQHADMSANVRAAIALLPAAVEPA